MHFVQTISNIMSHIWYQILMTYSEDKCLKIEMLKLKRSRPDSDANEPISKKAHSFMLASCANLSANLNAVSSK